MPYLDKQKLKQKTQHKKRKNVHTKIGSFEKKKPLFHPVIVIFFKINSAVEEEFTEKTQVIGVI